MRDHQGGARERFHLAQRLEHARLGIPLGIPRPGLTLVEAALDAMQVVRLFVRVRHDQAGVIRTRCIEFHAEELENFRYGGARLEQLGIGMLEVDLRMLGSAVIGGHHPVEPEAPCHDGVHGYGINGIAAHDWRGRIARAIPADAIAAVNVVITGEPSGFAGVADAGLMRRRDPRENSALIHKWTSAILWTIVSSVGVRAAGRERLCEPARHAAQKR